MHTIFARLKSFTIVKIKINGVHNQEDAVEQKEGADTRQRIHLTVGKQETV
jgi:hypothetical protein